MSCHTCGEPACGGCDPCNDNDSYCVCLGRQIEQLTNRTNQLKFQLECINTGEPCPPLCDIQSCDSPDCANTGQMCNGQSPTGRPVGAGATPDSCCGQNNPASRQDFCDEIFSKVRVLEKEVTKLDKLTCEIRSIALRSVLLDNAGNARGGLTVNGNLKTFTVGSWELATPPA